MDFRKRIIFSGSIILVVFLLFACVSNDNYTRTPSAGNYQKAIDLYNEGVNLQDSSPDKALSKYMQSLNYSNDIGEVYLNIGLIYISRGNYSKGEEYTLKAIDTFNRTGNKISESQSLNRLKAICHNNIGVIYLRKAQDTSNNQLKQQYKTKFISYFKKAMELDSTYKTASTNYYQNKDMYVPSSGKSGVEYYDEGVVLLHEKDYGQAIQMFEKAVVLDPSIGEAYLNIGLCYLRTGDYDKTEKYSKDAINTFRQYKKSIAGGQTVEELIAICYLNMGLAYIGKARIADSLGDYSDAKVYHESALGFFKQGMKEDPSYAHIKKVYNQYKNSYK